MGGKSSEHDVSLVSAKTVIENIDKDLYNYGRNHKGWTVEVS